MSKMILCEALYNAGMPAHPELMKSMPGRSAEIIKGEKYKVEESVLKASPNLFKRVKTVMDSYRGQK